MSRKIIMAAASTMLLISGTSQAKPVSRYDVCYAQPGAFYFYGYCNNSRKCDATKFYYSEIFSSGAKENVANLYNAFEAALLKKPGPPHLSVGTDGCFSSTESARREGLRKFLAKYPNNELIRYSDFYGKTDKVAPSGKSPPPAGAKPEPPSNTAEAAAAATLNAEQANIARRDILAFEARKKAVAAQQAANLRAYQQALADRQAKIAEINRKAQEDQARWRAAVAACAAGDRSQCAPQPTSSQSDAQPQSITWLEGIVVCPAKEGFFGSTMCFGPFQSVLASLKDLNEIRGACGTDIPVRDMGIYRGNRVFGCNFGINPTMDGKQPHVDQAKRRGIAVPDRRIFRCPAKQDRVCRS